MDTNNKLKVKDRYNEYMNEYMKKKYAENREKTLKYKNSLTARKTYKIEQDIIDKYKEYVGDIVKIKLLIDQLPTGGFSTFLNEYHTYKFERKEKN